MQRGIGHIIRESLPKCTKGSDSVIDAFLSATMKGLHKKYYQEKKARVESRECVTRAEYNRKYYVQNAKSLKSRASLRHVKAWDPLQLRPPLGVVEITLFLNVVLSIM